jgi:hypothetical protein
MSRAFSPFLPLFSGISRDLLSNGSADLERSRKGVKRAESRLDLTTGQTVFALVDHRCSPYEGGGHLRKPPINAGVETLRAPARPPYVLHWSILSAIPHKLIGGEMASHRFEEALSEAQELIHLARQRQADGEAQEAQASVVAALSALEHLLPPPEAETV